MVATVTTSPPPYMHNYPVNEANFTPPPALAPYYNIKCGVDGAYSSPPLPACI